MSVEQTVRTRVLDVAYLESGPSNGSAVVLLHGFPYDVHAYDAVAASLAGDGRRVIVPYLRGYGGTRFLDASTLRSGQQGALAADLIDLLDALDIGSATLAGYDWGGRAACIVAALWPERVSGLVTVNGYNIQDIASATVRPMPPAQEMRFWYQHYFNTARGPIGLAQHRDELCRLLWSTWSPTWQFDDATFARSAEAFENPDFDDVVIHSYRHRYGDVAGDPTYDEIEARLAARPTIDVPTIVLHGGDDGVAPPPILGTTERNGPRFTSLVDERLVPGAGHNLPQEAPQVIVESVRALAML